MLNYMMDYREDTPTAEVVDDAKYTEVKQRQEQRREEAAYYYRKKKKRELAVIPYAAAACAALLGVALYRNWEEPVVQKYYQAAKNTLEDVRYNVFGQGNMADSIEVAAEPVQEPVKTKDILVAEDNLNQALLEENAASDETGQAGTEPESQLAQEDLGVLETRLAGGLTPAQLEKQHRWRTRRIRRLLPVRQFLLKRFQNRKSRRKPSQKLFPIKWQQSQLPMR